MGILSRMLGFNNLSMEDPASPLLPYSALEDSLGLNRSDAGIMVNEKQALRLATVFSCQKIISEDLGRLPLEIFQEMPDGSMRLAKEHRLYPILHDRPNPNMSSMTWRGTMLASALSYGNGYSLIKRDNAFRVISIVPLDPSKTRPYQVDGKLVYVTTQTKEGQPAPIDPANILHILGPSLDGITGMSPIKHCQNVFGLAGAAEKFGAQFFGNGARMTGVFSHPNVLEDEAYENLKKSVREMATGENALRPVILEEGMKWTPISISPEEAQFLLTRKFQKEEIACLYRVPMHLLQDLLRATNNNIEHQGLDYVRFCLAPWAVKLEQEITYKLLGGSYMVEHNLNDLQRGDFASQTQGFQTLRNIGVYSTNRILRALRQNPISAEDGGDILTVQGAMIPLSSLATYDQSDTTGPDSNEGNPDESTGDPAATLRQRQISAAYRPLIRDAVGRAINRSGESQFTYKALQPIISSMYQALVAMRFGSCELTKSDLDRISSMTREIASGAPAWKKEEAGATASRLTATVYESLAKGLIQ